LLESSVAKRLAMWSMEYYDKYKKAPNKEIETIFFQKLKNNLNKELASEIEEDILPSLSKEYERDDINVEYLYDEAITYFNERNLSLFSDEIKSLIIAGKILEAEKLAYEYKPIIKDTTTGLDLADDSILTIIDQIFEKGVEPLIKFPGALGILLNEQLVRGGFVAFMGAEKRGKTWILLLMAMRAIRDKKSVAFFQAGDMSDNEQLMRFAIFLAKKSNKEKYCGLMHEPVKDCALNQNNTCKKDERACSFGVWPEKTIEEMRFETTKEEIVQAYKDNPDYAPCHHCDDFDNLLGVPWVTEVNIKEALTKEEAKAKFTDFFIKKKSKFKLSTHANNTLSVKQIKLILDIWEKQDGFTPDVIIVDYADIMIDETITEERPKQNQIWKDLRGLSQKRKALVITVTQTDADSYSKNKLTMKNFSEDKRKYGHVTAFYGLNQDNKGREKKIGMMRINEIVIRDGDFDINSQVTILQNLKRGQPLLTSYW
jgi:hypothetical protein